MTRAILGKGRLVGSLFIFLAASTTYPVEIRYTYRLQPNMSFMIHSEDIAPYGITNNSPPTHSLDLDGVEIHALFRYDNFCRDYVFEKLAQELRAPTDTYNPLDTVREPLAQDTYNRCLPALRLASLFLSFSSYFHYCLRNSPILANVTGIHNRPKRYLQKISPDAFTDANRDTIELQLNALAERVRFHVRDVGIPPNFTALSTLADDWYTVGPKDVRYFVHVKHHMDVIGSKDWVNLHYSKQMNILFKFAIDLVHETAHLLYWERFPNMPVSPPYGHEVDQDPYWDLSDVRKEVGTAWENWFLGYQVQRFPDQNVSDINLEAVPGHEKPIYGCMMTHVKSNRAINWGPFTQPDWFFARSDSVARFFDVRAWHAFEQFLQYPALTDNPLQLQLVPLMCRLAIEMPDGSDMSELSPPSEQRKLQESAYNAILQQCFLGRYNRKYEMWGDFAETSDSNDDTGNTLMHPRSPQP